jgi:hypothetical protein
MTTEVRQLPFKPHMLKGLSHRLLISHYANNNGEPEDVDLFTPFGAPSVLLKRGFGAWHAVGAPHDDAGSIHLES